MNTKQNTPPHTLEGEPNPAIWHKFEQDENGNLVNVLRTRNGNSAKAAMSAPELLEALELAIKMLEDDYKDGGNQHPTLNRFRAAIAKAKGTT